MTFSGTLESAFAGRSIFLTGHTGFKGSWLSLWLARLGARVTGYSLAPSASLNLFQLAGVENALARHILADIRDPGEMTASMLAAAPEVVFHLAAQPLVRAGYREPVTTWSTNVMGTVNVLEAVRACPTVKAVIVVTTDKCYQNQERTSGYCEGDPLGGDDPYSASKAATELVVHSYRKSFFSAGGPLLASARAGNVIGGGDWGEDRLIPDAARAIAGGKPLYIRNPGATRPWQHTLEALQGYLLLASRLLAGETKFADAFNFGPGSVDNLPVADVLARLQRYWPELVWQLDPEAVKSPHEAHLLYLDSDKARRMLGWSPKWGLETALESTAAWYRAVQRQPRDARAVTEQQLDKYRA